MEKIYDEDEGLIIDHEYKQDAWMNPKVRQKEIADDLNDFVTEFEQIIKQQEEQTGEKDDGNELEMMRALVKGEIAKADTDKQE